jgi:non-ribosomal peptide synthetase component F
MECEWIRKVLLPRLPLQCHGPYPEPDESRRHAATVSVHLQTDLTHDLILWVSLPKLHTQFSAMRTTWPAHLILSPVFHLLTTLAAMHPAWHFLLCGASKAHAHARSPRWRATACSIHPQLPFISVGHCLRPPPETWGQRTPPQVYGCCFDSVDLILPAAQGRWGGLSL